MSVEKICNKIKSMGLYPTKIDTGRISLVENLFNPEQHLKTGKPGRPRKIKIILRSHLRNIKKGRSFKSREWEGVPDPYIQCFYEILSMCSSRDMLYKCWPSMSNMSMGSNTITRVSESHPMRPLHVCLFSPHT